MYRNEMLDVIYIYTYLNTLYSIQICVYIYITLFIISLNIHYIRWPYDATISRPKEVNQVAFR